MNRQTALDRALQYASRGLNVFFVAGKMPVSGSRGYHDATHDEEQIAAMSSKWGDRATNLALQPGASGLLVVDVDSGKAEEDRPAHVRLMQLLDADPSKAALFESAAAVATGGGGTHYYFRAPEDRDLRELNGILNPSTDKREAGVDVRQGVGYVILPESVHPKTGAVYAWLKESAFETDWPEAPAWLLDFLKPPALPRSTPASRAAVLAIDEDTSDDKAFLRVKGIVAAACTKIGALSPGGRREEILRTSYRLGGLLHLGYPRESMEAQLLDAAAACGKTTKDTARAIRNGLDAGSKHETPLWDEKRYTPSTDVSTALRYWSAEHRSDDEDQIERSGSLGEEAPDPVAVEALEVKVNAKGIGNVAPTFSNVVTVLELDRRWRDQVRYNSFASGIEIKGEALADHLIHEIRLWIHVRYDFLPSEKSTIEAVVTVARRHTYNPLQEELRAMVWDGVPRLGTMLADLFGVQDNSDLAEVLGSKFMISAVARALDPGCQVDNVLVLHGGQGLYKSNGIRALFGAHLYSSSTIDVRNKDARVALQGRWALEWGELDSIKRSETTAIKAFITDRVDDFRPPYGKANVKHPRSCVFIGTTNDPAFLSDSTGDRRFWVVSCTQTVDVASIEAAREQLLAEAVARYDAGEQWWLTREEEEMRSEANERWRFSDPWDAIVAKWIHDNCRNAGGFTSEEVLTDKGESMTGGHPVHRTPGLAMAPDRCTQFHVERLGRVLERHGYVKARKRINGKRATIWVPNPDTVTTTEEG